MAGTLHGYAQALHLAQKQFTEIDPYEASFRGNVAFDPVTGEFCLTLFGESYRLIWPEGSIWKIPSGRSGSDTQGDSVGEAARAEETVSILALHYLLHASGIPLRNRWVTIKELPGGAIYLDAFTKRTLAPLAAIITRVLYDCKGGDLDGSECTHAFLHNLSDTAFDGRRPRSKGDFKDISERWLDGIRAMGFMSWGPGVFGDMSFLVRAFPRVPVAFVYWAGCEEEEMKPSANVLFDESAPSYLSTEDLIVLADLGVGILKRTMPIQM